MAAENGHKTLSDTAYKSLVAAVGKMLAEGEKAGKNADSNRARINWEIGDKLVESGNPGIRNPESESGNPNPESESGNPNPESGESESGIRGQYIDKLASVSWGIRESGIRESGIRGQYIDKLVSASWNL